MRMSPESGKQPRKRSRPWLQISLRTLLVIMTLAAVGAGAWRWYEGPFRRQRHAMRVIEKAGGSYEAIAAGPAWLRAARRQGAFQNITLVNVADCDDADAYLDDVSTLPVLETLVVGGPGFSDDHLRRLHGLSTLSGLVLDCTEVTSNGLASLHQHCPESRSTKAKGRHRRGPCFKADPEMCEQSRIIVSTALPGAGRQLV